MFCQKCRAPLKLHASLEDQLSPAAFDLLVGSTILPPTTKHTALPGKPNHPSDRREIYDKAVSSQSSASAIFKKVIPASRTQHAHGLAPNSNLQDSQISTGALDGKSTNTNTTTTTSTSTSNTPHTSRSIYQNPTESFVYLTESQVAVPPPQHSSSTSPYPTSLSTGTNRQNAGGMHNHHLQNQGGDMMGGQIDNLMDFVDKPAQSHQMKVSSKLFDILSAKSDIDHPICMECTDLLIDGLSKRLGNSTRERDAFVEFLKKVNSEIPTAEETAQAIQELEAIKAEEAIAIESLKEMERKKAQVQAELHLLEEEARNLDIAEEKFWRDRNFFALQLEEFQNERDGVNLQYDHDSRQLERLQRTNVYNDTFCIGHDGHFGTINGLRLGRLPNQPVEWPEINAAWGQTLLLLSTVAEKIKFTFEGYRLKPMGSVSKIEKIESTQGAHPRISSLELFSSGDLPLGRMFMHRKFDAAMVALLECLRQMGEYVEAQDSNVKMPYTISKDKIGDACIKLAFNQDEAWTKACKYTLTCAKFLLAYASNTRSLNM
ncbi:autophagy protein Apg6-domain-containing protein [Peziza echinospora]|nr:autophagy protein Apg6-domain-containing protein [Peziza echinospora]